MAEQGTDPKGWHREYHNNPSEIIPPNMDNQRAIAMPDICF